MMQHFQSIWMSLWQGGQLLLFLVLGVMLASLLVLNRGSRTTSKPATPALNRQQRWLDALPYAIVLVQDKEVVYANAAAMTMFRCKSPSAIGKHLSSMVDVYIRLISSQAWKRHDTQTVVQGKPLHLETSAVEVRHRNRPATLITLRETVGEHESRSKDGRLEAILEATPDFVLSFDDKGEILYCNPAARELFSSKGMDMPENIFALHTPEEAEAVRKYCLPEAEQRGHVSRETILRPGGGSELPVSAVYIAHSDSQHAHQYSLIARDIRAMLAEQRHREQIQRAETMSRLAGGVAHDLNNALMVILGNVTLARTRLGENSPVDNCLQRIEASGRHTSQLCHQLLSYAGRGHLEFVDFDLGQWLEKNQAQIRRLVPSHINLHIALPRESLPIRGDRAQILRILHNVLKNSCEAISGEGGQITISLFRQFMSEDELRDGHGSRKLRTGHYACLSVRDNGCGMDEHVLEHIFDPFFSTKSGDRGLGMNVVQGIMQSHRGNVTVHSLLHEGAEVQLYFPLVSNGQSRSSLRQAPPVPKDGKHAVLVVDDEENVREVTRTFLEHLDYHVYCADSGERALRIYHEHKDEIHVALLDVIMPGMDGYACFQRLRAIDPNLRVLFTSGYGEININDRFMEQPQVEFIAKPYTPESLQEKLAELGFTGQTSPQEVEEPKKES